MTPSADQAGLWLRRYRPSASSEATLVCFPHAGGSASYFRPVATELAPAIEVVAVQYPGRQDRRREPCLTDLGDLADGVYNVLVASGLDRPTAFFGHSLGAVLAFEVARRLEQRIDRGPRRLIVSGRRAPSRYRKESVHLRDDDGILAEIRRMAGTDPRLMADRELLATVLPAVRADYTAIETYVCRPSAAVDCPISVFVGDTDPNTTLDEAGAWREHTTDEFDLETFPGGHFYLDDHRAAVVAAIRSALRNAGTARAIS